MRSVDLNKKELLSECIVLFLITSCAAQSIAKNVPPQIINHILVGQNKNVFELQGADFDVLFKEGMVDGFLIIESYSGCTMYQFSIYDFEPKDGKANQLYINENLFQRFGTNPYGHLNDQIFWPLGYTEKETIEIFNIADMVIAAYNAFLPEATNKIINHIDPHSPYNLLYQKILSLKSRCEYGEKLNPEIFKKLIPPSNQ